MCPPEVDESTADKSELALGAHVDHSTFGLGRVMFCNAEHIVIDFDDHGEKAFANPIVLLHLKMIDRQPPVRKDGAQRAAAGRSLMPEGSLTPYTKAYLDDKWRLVVEVPTVGFSEERRELFKRCYGPDWPVVRCEWQAGGRKGLRLSPVQPLDAQFCNSITIKDRKIVNAIARGLAWKHFGRNSGDRVKDLVQEGLRRILAERQLPQPEHPDRKKAVRQIMNELDGWNDYCRKQTDFAKRQFAPQLAWERGIKRPTARVDDDEDEEAESIADSELEVAAAWADLEIQSQEDSGLRLSLKNLDRFLNRLDEKHRKVFDLTLMARSAKEIVAELGISQPTVSRALTDINALAIEARIFPKASPPASITPRSCACIIPISVPLPWVNAEVARYRRVLECSKNPGERSTIAALYAMSGKPDPRFFEQTCRLHLPRRDVRAGRFCGISGIAHTWECLDGPSEVSDGKARIDELKLEFVNVPHIPRASQDPHKHALVSCFNRMVGASPIWELRQKK